MAMRSCKFTGTMVPGGSTEAESSTSADMSQPLEEVVGGNDDKLH